MDPHDKTRAFIRNNLSLLKKLKKAKKPEQLRLSAGEGKMSDPVTIEENGYSSKLHHRHNDRIPCVACYVLLLQSNLAESRQEVDRLRYVLENAAGKLDVGVDRYEVINDIEKALRPTQPAEGRKP